MIAFQVVMCPVCPKTVVMEIALGISRGKCSTCRKRIWAMSDGKDVHVRVDSPLKKVAS